MAGSPKRSTTFQSALLPTSASLNNPFSECTTAVRATASPTGKNSENAGMSSVPSPKPEKKVSPEAAKAVTQMTM
jgi:hypothetical protein